MQQTTTILVINSINATGSFTYVCNCNIYSNRNDPVCDPNTISSVTLVGFTTTTKIATTTSGRVTTTQTTSRAVTTGKSIIILFYIILKNLFVI